MITSLDINNRPISSSLFQYAALFGVGKKLNLDIRLPYGISPVHEKTGKKIWQLKEIFEIKAPYITLEELERIEYVYTEQLKEFNPEIFNEIKENTNLIGLFEHPEYFEHCQDELHQQLVVKKEWLYEAFNKFSNLGVNPDKCIAIHVKNNNGRSILSADYYINSLNYIRAELVKRGEKAEDYKLLVFSDNINNCKKDFNSEAFTFIQNEGDAAEVTDFIMYSMCSNFIESGSNFSLWAAWIGNSLGNKISISPRKPTI